MKVLIIGSGSKEHALIWKLLASNKDAADLEILAIPGNKAISKVVETIDDIDITDIDRLLEIAIARNINLTIVGESQLFSQGIVNKFREAGKNICGPTKEAAEIEWSNFYAKKLMMDNNIPCPRFVAFDRLEMALAFLPTMKFPAQIRTDKIFNHKLATAVAQDQIEAEKILREMFKPKFLSNQTTKVIIEEIVEGHTFTVNTICDGTRALSLPPVQAYREENYNVNSDLGAYAPTPLLDDSVMYTIRNEIIDPTTNALTKDKRPYTGFLAFDITLDVCSGIKPKLTQLRTSLAGSDAQVILPLLDENLFEILYASSNSDLSFFKDGLHRFVGSALSVNVLSTDCRSDLFGQTQSLSVLEDLDTHVNVLRENQEGVPLIFYGTRGLESGKRITPDDDIVFGATAIAENLLDAQILAYKLVDSISLPSKSFHRHIGDQGMI